MPAEIAEGCFTAASRRGFDAILLDTMAAPTYRPCMNFDEQLIPGWFIVFVVIVGVLCLCLIGWLCALMNAWAQKINHKLGRMESHLDSIRHRMKEKGEPVAKQDALVITE